jgi:hypothetical protein
MDFAQLKAKLPSIGKHPFESEEVKKHNKADTKAGGTKLFKDERVRDVVECSNCSKPCCIYSLYSLNSKQHYNLSKDQQKGKLAELELFKDSDYVCGDKCPVEPFVTKQSIKCGQFVESMYYGFAKSNKGKGEVNAVCCFCSNDEDLVEKEIVMEKLDTTKSPLPICQDCFDRNISPPVVNTVTNFATKATVNKKRKKKQLDSAVAKNYRKGRKKS